MLYSKIRCQKKSRSVFIMTRTMAGLHLHFSKLIIFAFSDNFSAENSKSKLQLIQLLTCMGGGYLQLRGTQGSVNFFGTQINSEKEVPSLRTDSVKKRRFLTPSLTWILPCSQRSMTHLKGKIYLTSQKILTWKQGNKN